MRVVDDLATAVEEFPTTSQVGRREGYRSLLALPLLNRGRLVGVLTLVARPPFAFAQRDLGLHATVADLFAVAIENAHLYDEVREALRLRDEFIGSAAHELKTPVTVIKGWAQLLTMSHADDPEVLRALETIDRQADRVGRFIEDLLSASNLRPGTLDRALEPVDLSLFVRSLVDGLGGQVEQCAVRARADTPLPVLADRHLLNELIRRLLENAVRYSPPGGVVEVEARPSGHQAIVSVSDQGVGIAPERQPYVFEPFYQPVPPGVPGYVGVVSLGLHLSKQIVEAMGGRIWFVSEPGQGSTFSFSLPLLDSTAKGPPAAA
jgi:signal transduction histidine kinase